MNIPEAIKQNKRLRQELVGTIFPTNSSGDVVVESYDNHNHVTVRFVNTGVIRVTKMSKLRSGEIRDNSRKVVKYNGEEFIGCGIGLPYKFNIHPYRQWRSIIMRCYKPNRKGVCAAYNNCTMSKEWHDFEKFLEWYNTNKIIDDCCVDKDLLKKDNNIYCSENCCLVPQQINNAIIRQKSRRGKYPIGVHWSETHHKFGATIAKYGKCKTLGWFNSIDDAFTVYKQAKEEYLKELAELYKNKISEKVHNALKNYIVEITD